MNEFQRLWWEQTRADHAVLLAMRSRGELPSHQLHYLQMATEKLGKAYAWRTGVPPEPTHASFVPFLTALSNRPQRDRPRIAACLGFGRFEDLRNWIRSAIPLAYELERLAPALAGDGPNPEYPWPRAAPAYTPAGYAFPVWARLAGGVGAQLLRVIDMAITRFPDYC